jgi:hypothetical protein
MRSSTTACGVLFALCSAAPARAITGGVPSDARDDAVVLVLRDDGGRCTGTLIAPDLVVLALHCVAEVSSGPVACGDGSTAARGHTADGGRITADIAPERLRVYASAAAPSLAALPPVARGARVYRPAPGSVCGGDLAVLRLDRPVIRHAIAPVRLDREIRAGERISVVGYGRTEDGKLPRQRHRRDDLTVLRVGPAPSTGDLGALPGGSFEVGEGPCLGDSGGPAFDATTGALVGVFSGGGNPRARRDHPASPCLGPEVRNRYTAIAGFRALVLQAMHDAGSPAWREGALHSGIARDGRTARVPRPRDGDRDTRSSLAEVEALRRTSTGRDSRRPSRSSPGLRRWFATFTA